MNECRTKLRRLRNDLKRLRDEHHICHLAERSQAERIRDLEIENSALKEDVECLKQSLEWRDGVIADLRRKMEAESAGR
jgi:hypothetical protein